MVRPLSLCALILLAACSGSSRERFTQAEQLTAVVPGHPEARVWGDAPPADLRMLGMLPEQVAARRPGPIDYLALSSGGPAGAYGAGLLVGWTEAGTRPEFDVVTGVSSGALIAPFAFVGPQGDAALRELWAGGLAADIGQDLNVVGLLRGNGLVDAAPLRDLIDAYVDDDLIAAIARGHVEGRRLLVATTNLDAQRPVIWNLGAIASSGQPGASDLIRQILVASTSIPVAFAPTLIDAATGTRPIREMHVDGGVNAQIFALPDAALVEPAIFAAPAGREANLWLVLNYVLEPEFGVTPGSSFGVGARAYGVLIKSEVRRERLAVTSAAEAAGLTVRTGSITEAVPWDPREPFGAGYMGALFALGVAQAFAGTAFSQGADGPS